MSKLHERMVQREALREPPYRQVESISDEERHEEAIPAFDLAADRTETALQHRLGKVREGTSNRRRAEELRRDGLAPPLEPAE